MIRKCLPGGFHILPKNKNMFICESLLTHYEGEEEEFLHHILTSDETYVQHWIKTSKHGVVEGKRNCASPRQKHKQLTKQVLATTLEDSGHSVDIFSSWTKNSKCCKLLYDAKAAYSNKWHWQQVWKVILLHDNTRPNSATLTASIIFHFIFLVLIFFCIFIFFF